MNNVTQPQVRRLLMRHGIPVSKVYRRGGRPHPLVTKFAPCSGFVRIVTETRRTYQQAESVLTAAGYVFRDVGPDHQGNHLQFVVIGRTA